MIKTKSEKWEDLFALQGRQDWHYFLGMLKAALASQDIIDVHLIHKKIFGEEQKNVIKEN